MSTIPLLTLVTLPLMAAGDVHNTPAMRQYQQFKAQHPDCVLFFRIGDFYEMFYDDALLAHRVLGVTLTQRTEGIPMAGVPFHAVENYLRRMIQAGHRVAVCEQVEDAAQAKGIVQRDITRVLTPGTLTDEHLLDEGQSNPLAAVVFLGEGQTAAAWAELSTGEFKVSVFTESELTDELARIAPRELLLAETATGELTPQGKALASALGCPAVKRPAWQFRQREAFETLCRQFGVSTLEGFGLREEDAVLGPAAAVIHYLLETQRSTQAWQASGGSAGSDGQAAPRRLRHLQPPRQLVRGEFLIIDQTSIRSLEIEQTMRAGQSQGTLLSVLQDCKTPMGKRTLRQWLFYPLARREPIEQRLRAVSALVEDAKLRGTLRLKLASVQDVQRIISRVAVGRATPRDVVALGQSLQASHELHKLLTQRPAMQPWHDRLQQVTSPLRELAAGIVAACVESPPAHLREGGLIRDGHDAALDELRLLQTDSAAWLAQYQKQLIDETGIASLKVGFNRVFGFYIELSQSQRDKAPAHWSRKQTLKNAERFITPELKEYEGRVLTAEQRAQAREQELFEQLCAKCAAQVQRIQDYAQAIAELDVLACFAERAVRRRYVQPVLVDEPVLRVQGARHPVLEELIQDKFVANDVELGAMEGSPGASLALITGPNMAGKSTYIRQAALVTLLAHVGSFVPAEHAVVGLCDRIFTRIGASDELHAGQSTFMVEMTETANICHHATARSLVVLDEIGRGTSTLDGLSLAWAIAEHLSRVGCRTLFATHYHEITQLAEQSPSVTNLNVLVREWQDEIVFLHRISPGRADRSYGIHVAKIAGLPAQVIRRANELMTELEVSHHTAGAKAKPVSPASTSQMSLFTEYLPHPVVARLAAMDLAAMSPLQAFDALRKLQEELGR